MAMTYVACKKCYSTNRIDLEKAKESTPVCAKCGGRLPFHDFVSDADGHSLKALIKGSPLPVIVDFWASWCGPCRAFAPTFKQAAKKYAGKAVFVKFDTQAHQAAAGQYSIKGIPAILAFKKGREVARKAGAMPLPMFSQWIDSLL